MKALTLPNFKLSASLLAARLRKDIQKALTLEISRIFLWTDSTTVLQWIHFLENQPVFEGNCVAEILELTTTDGWNYVQSSDNPADAGTRGLSANALLESSWFKGPEFLKTPQWPFEPSGDFRRKLKKPKHSSQLPVTESSTTMVSATQSSIAQTFKWQKFCSHEKRLHIVAYMLRLLDKNSLYRCPTVAITDPAELEHAEQRLFYIVQSELLPSEKSNLLKSSPLGRTSKIAQFSPFIGPNGLIRASGRTKQLNVATIDVKLPVVLDGCLLLEHLHKPHCHQGVDYVRALVLQRLAVVKLRTTREQFFPMNNLSKTKSRNIDSNDVRSTS